MRIPKDFDKRPLKLRPVRIKKATPCAIELTALFNCWRTQSVDSARCLDNVNSLMTCMKDPAKNAKVSMKSNIEETNKWLSRLWMSKRV